MKQNSSRLKYLTTTRIQTLADGIFAIAMTLLVLSIQIPEIPAPPDNRQVIDMLGKLIPRFYSFALSFILLASFWKIHHRQYHRIVKLDNMHLWINMLWCLMVVLVPFSTSLMGGYGHIEAAALFFHGNLFLIGCLSLLSWIYAVRAGLTVKPLSEKEIKYESALNCILPLTSLIAMLACLVSPSWSSMAYFLIIPVKIFVRSLIEGRVTFRAEF